VSDAAGRFTAPIVLADDHQLDGFACGEPSLDDWLRTRARDNLLLGASRTYVTCAAGTRRVVGYYALAMGSILAQEVPGAMRRNMPRVIPAVVLGRLAIDQTAQGVGLGGQLLQDAVQRAGKAAQEVSARLVLVHALSSAAAAFYERHGFVRLPVETPTLALDLMKLARVTEAPSAG